VSLSGDVTAPSRAEFWASDTSVLSYCLQSVEKTALRWVVRDGRVVRETGNEDTYDMLRLSPDGKKTLIERIEPSDGKRDLWLLDLERGITNRLTTDGKGGGFAVWSPDGRSVAYSSPLSGVVRSTAEMLSAAGRKSS